MYTALIGMVLPGVLKEGEVFRGMPRGTTREPTSGGMSSVPVSVLRTREPCLSEEAFPNKLYLDKMVFGPFVPEM